MSSLIILFVSAASALVGRWSFGRWYNHVTLYSMVWGVSLAMFEIRFINYYALESETWIYIVVAWLSFLFGSVTVRAIRGEVGTEEHRALSFGRDGRLDEIRLLPLSIWILTSIALVVTIHQWQILIRMFGSVTNAIVLGNIVYSLRVRQILPGSIPYLDSLALSATCLAGIYAGVKGKLRPVVIYPILVTILGSIAGMGRAKLLLGGILFVSGYFLVRQRSAVGSPDRRRIRIRRALVMGTVFVLIALSFEAIRSSRGTVETIPGATRALTRMRAGAFITPSIYLYLTVHHGVLNSYMERQDEKQPWGANTFAPFMRILNKFDLVEYVPEYQKHYRTPAGSNTGTYVRELHADFGYAGVLLVPYLLGCIASILWYRAMGPRRLTAIVLLSHIYVIVVMSFITSANRLGYWWVSLAFALGISWVAERSRPTPLPNSWNSQ